jgi:hypothetical protein
LATAAGPSIARKIIEAAKNGDPNAQRPFCQHLLPKPKFVAAATPVDLASPSTAQDAAQGDGISAFLPTISPWKGWISWKTAWIANQTARLRMTPAADSELRQSSAGE